MGYRIKEKGWAYANLVRDGRGFTKAMMPGLSLSQLGSERKGAHSGGNMQIHGHKQEYGLFGGNPMSSLWLKSRQYCLRTIKR